MKKFLRWIASTTLAGAMLVGLSSCGGGGVSSDTGLQVGTLAVLPATGTLYANAPFVVTIAGGTRPYFVTSNEQTVLPLTDFRIDGNTFTVTPNNPGVIDAGLEPDEVPFRTVNLSVRDNRGTTVTVVYRVLQNFLTGYSVSVAALNNCGVVLEEGETPIAACSGLRSRVFLRPTTNGLIQRNKQLRLSVLTGTYSMVTDEVLNTLGPSVVVTTDELGQATGQLEIPSTAITQFATLRITDVASGVYRDHTFTIFNIAGPLAVLPTSISIAGLNSASCGSGITDIIVTGGTPPYTATATQPSLIAITPTTVTRNGGSFSVTIFPASLPNCLSAAIQVMDSAGRTATVTVTTTAGTTPPTQPLTVAPNQLCLADGSTATLLVTGGNMNKVVNSTNVGPVPAGVTVAPAAGTGTFNITLTATGVGGVLGNVVPVTVNDGGTQAFASVTRKTVCP